jgi:hypothetical protein
MHPHPLSGQEILFTRQRHDAKRAGLHYDYRLVLGEKAYSWATKKELPQPGSAVILFEQPVHDRAYALSRRIEIPEGNYGHGVTTLDWVRKARIDPETESDKLVINSGKERFLLKKLDPVKYGERAWLFKNLNPYKEGESSTLTHDGQTYRVDDAISLGAQSKIKHMQVSDLDWILPFGATDPERLTQANTKVPILISNFRDKMAVIDGLHRLKKAKEEGLETIPTRYVDTSKLKAYTRQKLASISPELQSRFKPDFTPKQMEALGVLKHKGSQYGEGIGSDNFFGVRASLDTWPDKWHNDQHPQGWYQWYQGYASGKRTSDDERQMKRWLSFKARHLAQLKKVDPELSNLEIQPKRRQALLNWGINTGIDENRYLSKIAMDPLSMLALHGAGAHVAQNIAMKAALKTKTLAKYVGQGFAQGTKGVIDTSWKAKAKQFALGATLPDINILRTEAHKLGRAMGPSLDKMSLRQKGALRSVLKGTAGPSAARALNSSPSAIQALTQVRNLGGQSSNLLSKAKSILSRKTKLPLVDNVVRNLPKGKVVMSPTMKPGAPSARSGILGSLATSVVDPVTSGVNFAKSVSISSKFRNTRLGAKITEKFDDLIFKKPFKQGLAGGKSSKVGNLASDLLINPIRTQVKETGKIVSNHL